MRESRDPGRAPNLLELGIFSVMWSEHCSYKSSRHWLKRLPTEAPWVICGPGENAGVVDLGGGMAAIFKIESHNHPSYIEPIRGGDRGRRHPARRVHHGGAARRASQLAPLRRAEHPRPAIWSTAWSPASAATATASACPRSAKRLSTAPTTATSWSTRCASAWRRRTRSSTRAAGPGNPGALRRVQDRPRRHPRRDHGIGGVLRGGGGAATDRAGRRSVHREAAARGLPRADADGRDRRDPGHGRGRPHLVVVRDGRARRRRDRAGPGPRADPRGRHDPYEIMLWRARSGCSWCCAGAPRTRARSSRSGPRLRYHRAGDRDRRDGAALRRPRGGAGADRGGERGAPVYQRPWQRQRSGPAGERARRPPADRSPGALRRLLGSPDLCSRRWIFQQYDQTVMGDTVPGRRCRRDPDPRHRSRDRADHRLHAPLLRRRPAPRRHAGGRRGLAQSVRGRRAPARADRLPELRQPENPRSWASSSAASRACARPAWRSTSRSSPATCRSTTRPTASRSGRRRRSAAWA